MFAHVGSKVFDVCTCGSFSSHDTDERQLDTFRDARVGHLAAVVPAA